MADETKDQASGSASDVTVLVTGASGFIASHIVKKLLDRGYKVRGTVRGKPSKYDFLHALAPQSNPKALELFQCDLSKNENWDKAVAGCTYVFHTANPMPEVDPAKAGLALPFPFRIPQLQSKVKHEKKARAP